MVKFLLNRPIAVTMTFIALLVLGGISMNYIPVSLMPDIDIPEITVQVQSKNTPARELENTVVKPLRRHLIQVAHLSDIKSETRDESGIIELKFDYGTGIDYAFIEVNEKIDRAMNTLPREVTRPKVIKASATDIPVFYLNLTLKTQNIVPGSGFRIPGSENQTRNNKPETTNTEHETRDSKHATRNSLFPVSAKFMELSRFAGEVIRKRIEQLPEVAMVDMSGMTYPELLIIPDMEAMRSLNLGLSDLENAIRQNDINLGNLLIKDGQYQYNIRFNTSIKDIRDIQNIYLKVDNRLFQLKDLAEVIEHPQKRKGMVVSNGQDAVTLAIIKQSDARMDALKEKLHSLTRYFRDDYPDIQFAVIRDQTQLLDYSISNLQQSLLWGALLAFVVMFFFLKDVRAPLLIGITIPVSIVIALLLFHLFQISINIISLSGLVLGVGMMIDNSIIVIDNIMQYKERGENLLSACMKGTNEVIRPLLSSVLTTCAVFIPLIFLSGISGALFYDQAVAVSIGLFVSLAVSITILPVYYKLFYQRDKGYRINRLLSRLNRLDYETLYERGFRAVMQNQKTSWGIFIAFLAGSVLFFGVIPKSKLPAIERDEMILAIDWNEKINIEENGRRVHNLLRPFSKRIIHQTGLIGSQQFLLDKQSEATASEATIYIKTHRPAEIDRLKQDIDNYLGQSYPTALYNFETANNIFDLIFSDEQPPLTARLRMTEGPGPNRNELLANMLNRLKQQLPEYDLGEIPWQEHLVLKVDPTRLKIYDVTFDELYGKLQSAFNENEIMLITDNEYFVPVILGGKSQNIGEILSHTFVEGKENQEYPVEVFLTQSNAQDLKQIVAGQEGEYFPVNLEIEEEEAETVMESIRAEVSRNIIFEVDFSGSIFSNKELFNELLIVLLISLALLYFILASQFESLTLPLIVLLEVPIDIFGAFLLLKLFGMSINVMSMIGIVVMSGIIINDSILKIDTINHLRQEGHSLMQALMIGGQRRLKPILMTSLTTILALMPFLFTGGLGADLQKPLALAVIGGMIVGTLVSLYFIPLCYYYLERKNG